MGSTVFPGSSAGKESACSAGDEFDRWVGKIAWRREELPTPGFLPVEESGGLQPMGSQSWT